MTSQPPAGNVSTDDALELGGSPLLFIYRTQRIIIIDGDIMGRGNYFDK